ncbi:hypothetical protein [Ectobacillus polymachus]|uniref:hypothetical protein n=1 Tax=Ectobacillus polymachus TaxID=1508806 RepID=UPI003A8684F5
MSKKDKKPSTRTLAKEAIENRYKNNSQSPPLIVSANLPNNKTGFAAVSSNSIETFQYNKNNNELTLIGTYNLSDYSEVYVDHFAMKSEFKFQGPERNPFYFIPTENGKGVESIIKNYTSIVIHNIERKWYKKILGFRSGKKWKMVVASLVYLFILSAVLNGMTNNKPSTSASDTSTNSTDSATDAQTTQTQNTVEAPKETPEQAQARMESEKKAKQDEYEKSKIKLNGSGDTATDTIKLKKGFAIFDMKHDGGANFIVHLQGNSEDSLVNEIGQYSGKTIAVIPTDGDYALNVKADGDWSALITQEPDPSKIPTIDGSYTLNGHGDDVVFFDLSKAGLHKLTLKHDGESNFIVHDLSKGTSIVNEIGKYSGSTREQFEDGLNGFSVKADGDWSIVVE